MSTETAHIEKKKTLAPKLRFKEFSEKWITKYVNDVASKLNVGFVGTCEPFYTSREEGVLLVRTGNLKGVKIILDEEKYVTKEFNEKNKKSQIFPGDLLLARHGGNGEICMVPKGFPAANSLNIVILRTSSEIDSSYFQLSYSSFAVQRQISSVTAGSTQGVINTSEIGKLKITFPSLPEQQKIASFLSSVDEKIQQLTRKKELLEQYKKGVMQQLFSGKLRFKDENGKPYPKWEERKLSSVLYEHKIKSSGKEEVFSVSVHKGLINQVEHLGRVFAAKNTDNYNLVKPGDIVYTKSPTGDFPLGIIKQSKLTSNVIVSPLYGVFTPETYGLGYLLNVYFESPVNVSNYLSSIIQKGAKNTINITNTTFLSKGMVLPVSKDEQEKIGKFFIALDAKIETVANQITQAQTFKKGLLQQMFV